MIKTQETTKEFTNWLCQTLISETVYRQLKSKPNKAKLFQYIPELKKCDCFRQNNPYHCHNLLNHMFESIKYERSKQLVPRLALLLHDIAKPDVVIKKTPTRWSYPGHGKASAALAAPILERLGFDCQTTAKVLMLIENHDMRFPNESLEEISELNHRLYCSIYNKGICNMNDIPALMQDFIYIREADICGQDHRYIIERIEKVQRLITLINQYNTKSTRSIKP